METMQQLMDAAYDRLREHHGWTKRDFWDDLDRDERVAVFFGNLNYQVRNGGLSQWWGNRYATDETVPFIIRTCAKIDTDAARAVAGIVEKAWAAIDDRDERHMDEDEWEELADTLDALDSEYDKVGDQFLQDVEAYLTREVAA